MVALFDELIDQPRALRELVDMYRRNPGLLDFGAVEDWALTGMGASYHAALIGALFLRARGARAAAYETVDLFQYASPGAVGGQQMVYISQSGSSGEVGPFLDWIPERDRLAVITNHAESELAARAGRVLPMQAGLETLIAAKTYVNTLGILWLLARRWGWDGSEFDQLAETARRAEDVFARAGEIRARFSAFYDPDQPLLFLGHGPHAVTARMAAMGMSEWAKVPALHAGSGAFRHGFIESVHPGQRVVIFAPPGRTQASALALAAELRGYGAEVLLIANGRLCEAGEIPPPDGLDELLSPLLDIMPVQIAADELAKGLEIGPGFKYISKVVRQV